MDIRERYVEYMRGERVKFLQDRSRMPVLRSDDGMRVRAVLPESSFLHLRDHHGVSLNDKDQVDWLLRTNPEAAPREVRGRVRVALTGSRANTETQGRREGLREQALTGGPARVTRFGRASFSKTY